MQSILNWLGEVGGNLGLYIGASVFTIVEIVVVIIGVIEYSVIMVIKKIINLF